VKTGEHPTFEIPREIEEKIGYKKSISFETVGETSTFGNPPVERKKERERNPKNKLDFSVK